METPIHSMTNLFAQLGLPSEEEDIERFIQRHPLPSWVSLPEAPFWTPAQAAFLREKMQENADWAEVIDELNVELHLVD